MGLIDMFGCWVVCVMGGVSWLFGDCWVELVGVVLCSV